MQSLFDYIISTENRYNNTINVDGKELVVNTEITERDYMFVNRIGKIIQVPVYNNSIFLGSNNSFFSYFGFCLLYIESSAEMM